MNEPTLPTWGDDPLSALLSDAHPVLREPHRRFVNVRREVDLALVRRIGAHTLLELALGGRRVVRVDATRSPYARALRGLLPETVHEDQMETTHDTPENRFVKSFLFGMELGVIRSMRELVAGGSVSPKLSGRIPTDCAWMERKLRPQLRNGFWRNVGPMTYVPVASTVLQRRRGYRSVYRHFVKMRLAARVPLSRSEIQDLLEIKDIAKLYELWCYFTIVEELERILGRPERAERLTVGPTGIETPWEYSVVWRNRLRALYNPRFSRSQPGQRFSYSVVLRPDIGFEIANGRNKGLHLMDAKFRLDRVDEFYGDNDAEVPEAGEEAERRGAFKQEDLYKMHTYRDSIPSARSVWILYPGTERCFFGVTGERVTGDDAPILELMAWAQCH